MVATPKAGRQAKCRHPPGKHHVSQSQNEVIWRVLPKVPDPGVGRCLKGLSRRIAEAVSRDSSANEVLCKNMESTTAYLGQTEEWSWDGAAQLIMKTLG